MKDKNSNLRGLLLMIAAALFVVALICLMAFAASRRYDRNGIELPSDSTQDAPASSGDTGLVAVSAENAAAVAARLTRPARYHQSLTIEHLSGEDSATHRAEIWASGVVRKLEVTENGTTRHILTDGATAYVWYGDESWTVRTVALGEDVTADDLSGVPSYEVIASLSVAEITEAQYVTLADLQNAPCLYVSANGDTQVRYWVDLTTGLLCKADAAVGDETVYRLTQTAVTLPEIGDEELQKKLLLPNGTQPFLTEAG